MTKKKELICCLCNQVIADGIGNNPEPLTPDIPVKGRCCDSCNTRFVLPARLGQGCVDVEEVD